MVHKFPITQSSAWTFRRRRLDLQKVSKQARLKNNASSLNSAPLLSQLLSAHNDEIIVPINHRSCLPTRNIYPHCFTPLGTMSLSVIKRYRSRDFSISGRRTKTPWARDPRRPEWTSLVGELSYHFFPGYRGSIRRTDSTGVTNYRDNNRADRLSAAYRLRN